MKPSFSEFLFEGKWPKRKAKGVPGFAPIGYVGIGDVSHFWEYEDAAVEPKEKSQSANQNQEFCAEDFEFSESANHRQENVSHVMSEQGGNSKENGVEHVGVKDQAEGHEVVQRVLVELGVIPPANREGKQRVEMVAQLEHVELPNSPNRWYMRVAFKQPADGSFASENTRKGIGVMEQNPRGDLSFTKEGLGRIKAWKKWINTTKTR